VSVVQVIGELSNDGGPLRSFVQTFLLVAQSPKKYYVHNDIFRYLDEVQIDDGKTNAMTDIVSDHCNDVENNGEGSVFYVEIIFQLDVG
jgi:Ras GTPase-activating protein-binding protein 1